MCCETTAVNNDFATNIRGGSRKLGKEGGGGGQSQKFWKKYGQETESLLPKTFFIIFSFSLKIIPNLVVNEGGGGGGGS